MEEETENEEKIEIGLHLTVDEVRVVINSLLDGDMDFKEMQLFYKINGQLTKAMQAKK